MTSPGAKSLTVLPPFDITPDPVRLVARAERAGLSDECCVEQVVVIAGDGVVMVEVAEEPAAAAAAESSVDEVVVIAGDLPVAVGVTIPGVFQQDLVEAAIGCVQPID